MSTNELAAEAVDIADQIAVGLIAVINGDNEGAATVLERVDPGLALKFLAALLTLTADLGVAALGPQAFVAAITGWRDAMSALPGDWWERHQGGQ